MKCMDIDKMNFSCMETAGQSGLQKNDKVLKQP